MDFQKKNVKNICSLYASEWHLTVMLLPYISRELENGVEFKTILKNEIAENVEELVSKLNLNEITKEKMLNINWKKSEIDNQENINKFMNNIVKNEYKISIILNGTNKQVEENNKMINKWIEKNIKLIQENNIQINIISCFKALEFKENISSVINKYDYTLNTSGEHRIEEIFNVYKNKISK